MERDPVDDRDQQQRPMRAALCLRDIAAIVNGEEDMGGPGKVWERFTESARVGSLKNHKGHAGSEKNDVGCLVIRKEFMFKISGAKGGSALRSLESAFASPFE